MSEIARIVDEVGSVTTGTTTVRAGCSCGSVLLVESDVSMQALDAHSTWRAAHDAEGHHGVMPEEARRIRQKERRRNTRQRQAEWRASRG